MRRFIVGVLLTLLFCYLGGQQINRRLEEEEFLGENSNDKANDEEGNGNVVVQQEEEDDDDTFHKDTQAASDNGTSPLVTLLDDGTLLVKPMPESVACSYFTQLPNLPKRVGVSPNRIHFHFDDCSDDNLGTRLAEHFGHYLLANAAQVPYTMTCGTGVETEDSVLNQLQLDNENPGPPPKDVTKYVHSVYDVCYGCYGLSWWCKKGPELMTDIIHDTMWYLANTDLGKSIEAEDAVVHLRLGDAVASGTDNGLGLLPFRSYSRLLRRAQNERGTLQTISIVTESFDPNAVREDDRPHVERSEKIAKEFLAHLQENFPDAQVKLHNDPLDTPLVTYIRLLKATKVAVCGASTFCTYPVMANQGIRYFYDSDKINPWTKRLRFLQNVHSFATNRLASNYAGSLSEQQLLHWLRHQDPNGNEDITSPPLFRVPKTQFALS